MNENIRGVRLTSLFQTIKGHALKINATSVVNIMPQPLEIRYCSAFKKSYKLYRHAFFFLRVTLRLEKQPYKLLKKQPY